jgi:hypothetical protein
MPRKVIYRKISFIDISVNIKNFWIEVTRLSQVLNGIEGFLSKPVATTLRFVFLIWFRSATIWRDLSEITIDRR